MHPDGKAVELVTRGPCEGIFASTNNRAMWALSRMIQDIADTDVPVLLLGETGTGKDVFAWQIHQLSRRKTQPFAKVHCSLLPAEFFAPKPPENGGSYSSWSSLEPGTLFFEHVEDLDTVAQAALLQALSGRDTPSGVGGIRVIASARGNLEQQVQRGRFREDLYYHLSGICLNLPPLRQRREDIGALIEFFLTKYAKSCTRPMPALSREAVRTFQNYSWPGNIAELESAIRRIVLASDECSVVAEVAAHLGGALVPQAKDLSLKQVGRTASRHAERELILEVLSQTRWNRKRAAQQLHISYKALLYKLKQMKLDSASSQV